MSFVTRCLGGRRLLPALAAILLPTLATAHSPYLMPNRFDVGQRDHVSVQASFTEAFFIPDVVMRAPDYHVVAPSGERRALDPVYTQDLAVLEVPTIEPGTYRISTGVRESRKAKAIQNGRGWTFLSPREAAATKQPVYEMQSVTHAEVYVSRGAPSDEVLTPRGQGLEFDMKVHPNRLLAGSAAPLRVLFNGRPVVDEVITLRRAQSDSGDVPAVVEVRTDASGLATLPLPNAGIYHVMMRYRFALPEAELKAQSHTYALTLEVTD